MDSLAILSKVPLFADALDGKQLAVLARESEPAFFLDGTRLMSQGELGGAMFVIVSGAAAVSFVHPDGREQEVARLGPGDIVGEMSLFTGDRRTATVTATGNVDALKISKASLERIFAKAPELIDTFSAFLARRQAQLDAVSRQKPPDEGFIWQARKAFASLFRP